MSSTNIQTPLMTLKAFKYDVSVSLALKNLNPKNLLIITRETINVPKSEMV